MTAPELNIVPIPTPESEITFDDFWTLYPRHIAKKDAVKAWSKINPDLYPDILSSLVKWRGVWSAKTEIQFIPYPATWLNGERWTDEIPQITAISARGVSHHSELAGPRSVMPDHVREMIAKLKRPR